ncbi:YD repeat protein [Chthoniobacter flavus Ellin428]|uniref:YD repeat protein n=1 Tax=Chthoniobacter flavus Ellin428 TaxID=497964 RepID=B4D4J0_9BACT|nr:YD repeat protein [Chthoniobacter flavus Ellin428]TCO82167.1 intein/RHS repeat-associated protein [Chthoniobacter flavus]
MRIVALFLIPVLLLTTPEVVWAANAVDGPANPNSTTPTPRPVQGPGRPPTRTLPVISTAPEKHAVLSVNPSEKEVTDCGAFLEPLVPVGGTPSEADNQKVARLIAQWRLRTDVEDFSLIDAFVRHEPNSPWIPGLLLNKGLYCRKLGYFSQALTAWQEAWNRGKGEQGMKGKALMDRAAGELAELNGRLGRYEWLTPFFKEIEGRDFRGSATEKIAGARQGLWLMENRPADAFRCGPMALDRIRAHQDQKLAFDVKILKSQSTRQGMNLASVQELAGQLGMDYLMVRRDPGASLAGMVPAVIHWKVGHYAALTAANGNRFRVEDPTFGGAISVSQRAIDAEGSGYFLVPRPANGNLPDGWHLVSASEGQKVWGKGNTGASDPNRTRCNDIKVRGGCCGNGHGMADYDVHAMLVSLNIVDTPGGYTPPRGLPVSCTVRYSQREANQPAIFTYSNFGNKWTCDWFSYVEYSDIDPTLPPMIYLPGGGAEIYPDLALDTIQTPNGPVQMAQVTWGSDQTYYPPQPFVETANYQPQQETMAVLQKTGRTTFIKTYLDGSVETYDHLATQDIIMYPRRLFLTKRVDALGNEMDFTYDSDHRLRAVTDGIGQVTTLYYENASDPLKVTSVEDPFGRTAHFDYNAQGQLSKITDVVGMTSEFTYGTGDFINSLTTGYGTTTFAEGESGTTRWVEVTDPNGDKERTEFIHQAPGMVFSEPAANTPAGINVFNQYLNYRDTYYWNKAAYKEAFANGGHDYTRARQYHWLHSQDVNVCSGTLETTKEAYENRVWMHYQGQTAPGFVNDTMMMHPDVVARVIDDGSTQLSQFQYNEHGKVTSAIDPLGRETDFTYDDSGVHVKDVKQKLSGGGSDLLSSATYNAQGQILTTTDTAGQTTTMTYNGHGQIASVQDALGRTTTFDYDGDGYGTTLIGPEGVGAAMGHDGYGRISQITNSDGYTVQMEYDDLNRPTRTTYPDGSYEQITYNLLDAEWTRDRLGRWTHSFHNALKQLVGVEDPANQYTGYVWCLCGALKTINDPMQHSTTWHHDAQGRVTSKEFPDGSSETYAYQPLSGRLSSVTDALGQQTQYIYNVDNSTASVVTTSPLGRPGVGVSYTYDTDYSRLSGMTDSDGVTGYSYVPAGTNGAGQIASVDGPLTNDTIAYTYNEMGQPTSQSIGGVASSVHYDSLGRVDTVTNPLGTFTHHYEGASNRVSYTDLPNGQRTAYGYFDNSGDRRLQSIANTTSGGTVLSASSYTYTGPGGLIQNWTKQKGGQDTTQLVARYDAADRLSDASVSDTVTGAELNRYVYHFDAADNRTSEQNNNYAASEASNLLNQLGSHAAGGTLKVRGAVDKAAAVTVNGASVALESNNTFEMTLPVLPGNNQFQIKATDGNGNLGMQNYQVNVPAWPTQSLFYDLVGNLTSKADGTNNVSYEWDAANNLIAIDSGTHRTEFGYNGQGQRVKITEKENGVVTDSKRLLWNGMTLCEERDATGATVNKRFFGGGEQVANGPSAGSYYYATDHLGNISEMTDSTGAVRADYDYTPYGTRTKTAGDLDTNLGFTGHYLHQLSGLYLTPTRLYDPATARWLARDPIGEDGGLNLYAYVGGNPLNAIDPSGQSWGGFFLGVGVGVLAGLLLAPLLGECLLAAMLIGAISGFLGNMAEQWYDKGWGCIDWKAALRAAAWGALLAGAFSLAGEAIGGFVGAEGGGAAEGAASRLWCFLPGTLVDESRGEIPIEKVQLGDRVVTTDHAQPQENSTEVVPTTWHLVRLRMPNPDRSKDTLEMAFLRSNEWMSSEGCEVGKGIWLQMSELGIAGWAQVETIEPCPTIQTGDGRVVTGMVTHLNGYVLRLHFDGTDETISPTVMHRLYSATRHEWVRAGELNAGEMLKTHAGTIRVASIEQLLGIHRVYNIEVEAEHRYFVGKAKILSHNGCGNVFSSAESQSFKSFAALKTALGSPGEGNVWHHIVEQAQESRFGAAAIHNTDNVIAISAQLNSDLNALYSSIRPQITGSINLTVRDWLRTKSLQQNYDFGRAALHFVSTGQW